MNIKNINLYAFIILLLSTLLSIFMYWGVTPFLGDATYLDFNVMQNFLSGNGFATGPNIHGDNIAFGKRPPGFSLLVGFFVSLGFPILFSSKIITTLSFVLSAIFIFYSLKYFYNDKKSFFATLLFVCYIPFIYYSKIAAPEIVGILVLTAMLYYYLKFIDNVDTINSNMTIFLFGFISGSMIWIRYANMIYVLIFFVSLFIYTFFINKKDIKNSFLTLSIGTIVTISMMARNYFSTGNLTGHPSNNIQTNEFMVAILKSLNTLTENTFAFNTNNSLVGIIFIIVLSMIMSYIIYRNYKDKKVLFMLLPIALMPLSYLLFFCYIQSTTRIDDVSSRYLLPFFLSIMLQIIYIVYDIQARIQKRVFYYNTLLLIILSVFIYSNLSKAAVIRKYNDRDYSPITLEYMIKNTKKDDVVIGNRYLSQIFMHSLDYRVVAFPFYSKYNKDYGRKLKWSKYDFLKIVTKHNINTVVFFTGPDKRENFIKKGDYGSFVTGLINSKSNLIESKIVLVDGYYIKLISHSKLQKELDNIKKSIFIINNNKHINKLKIVNHNAKVSFTKNGLIINEKNIKKSSLITLKFIKIKNSSGVSVTFQLPKEKIKMLSFTLRSDKGWAHFFVDKKSFKFGEVELIPETISRQKNFNFDSIKSLSIRAYPIKSKNITNLRIKEIKVYARK